MVVLLNVPDLRRAFTLAGDAEPFVVRPLTPDDGQDYLAYCQRLPEIEHYPGYLEGKDLSDLQTYKDLYDQTVGTGQWAIFGMWRGDQMIGQSAIQFMDTQTGPLAYMTGSEIAGQYRGKRLVDHFYAVRADYLRQLPFEGTIRADIRPGNGPSIKAAERNGFQNTGVTTDSGFCIFKPA